MIQTFSVQVDNRTAAEHTAARLASNGWRWVVVCDNATAIEAEDFAAELQALGGIEAYVDSYLPPVRVEHGAIELTLEQRKAIHDRALAESPPGMTLPPPPKTAHGRRAVQDPATCRVFARFVGVVSPGTDAPAPRSRRLAGRSK